MDILLEYIAKKSPRGIPYPEAVQLMLLLYGTLDILPKQFRSLALSRKRLAVLFSNLTARGLVRFGDAELSGDGVASASDPTRPEHWEQLVERLIRGRITMDDSFLERASQYV